MSITYTQAARLRNTYMETRENVGRMEGGQAGTQTVGQADRQVDLQEGSAGAFCGSKDLPPACIIDGSFDKLLVLLASKC